MRKVLLLLAIAVAVAIGFSMSTLKTKVTRAVAALGAGEAGGDVSVGEVRLRIWPPAVDVHDVSVRHSDRPKADALLEASVIHVYPEILPLLVGRARIRAVEAVSPHMLIRRELREGRPVVLLPLGGPESSRHPGFPVEVRDGKLKFQDTTVDPRLSLVVTGLDLQLTSAAEDGSVRFDATAAALGEDSRVTASGTLRAADRPDVMAWVDVEFAARNADPRALEIFTRRLVNAPLAAPLSFEGTAKGPLGARSTEAAPAEPLEGTVRGQLGLSLLGRNAPLAFEAEVALDDKRFLIRRGSGRWEHLDFEIDGYSETYGLGRISYRFTFDEIDTAAVLAGFDVEERWRPRGTLSATVKVAGPRPDPRIRYEATGEKIEFDGLPDVPIAGHALDIHGSLLSVNADVSASVGAELFKIAEAELPDARFGILYWRDKLSLNQRELPLWGGALDISVGYQPDQGSVEGGGLVNNMDAGVVADNLVPGLALGLEGRLDSIFQVGYDARGPWTMGRIGVHYGKLGATGLGHDVLASLARARGKPDSIDDALLRRYADTLSPEQTGFKRLAFDFESREEGFALRAIQIDLEDANVRGEVVIDQDGVAAGWGSMSLEADLTTDLIARMPELRALAGPDGRLRLAIRVQGPTSDLVARVDDRFVQAVDKAARGEQVGPFVPMEPDSRIVMDLPTLREQFYR